MIRQQFEKREQAETVKLLELLGAAVYTLGTRRPRGTRCPDCGTFVAEHAGTCQTAGLPDLLVFLPGEPRQVLCIEQKAPGGSLSPAQVEFRRRCQGSTAQYVSGTAADVIGLEA